MTTSLRSPTARKLMADLDAELVTLYPDHPYPPPLGDADDGAVGTALIVYQDRRAVGCGAVRLLDDDTAELLRMYVLPDVRGQGLGKLLLAALEDEAEALGVRRMVLEAGDRQPDAVGLYRQSGWVDVEPWVPDPNPHSVFMTKRVR